MKIITFLYFFITLFSFGQVNNDTTIIFQKDTLLSLEKNLLYRIDTSRKQVFSDLKNQKFQRLDTTLKNYQATHWYKFDLDKQINTKYFVFFSMLSDDSDIIIPFKNDYKSYNTGVYSKNKKIKFNISESSFIIIPTDSIDFSKSFYFNKKILTNRGQLSLNLIPMIMMTDQLSVVDNLVLENSLTNTTIIYTSIFIFSFLLFLVNFFITKDKNFLNYSLYLLFISIIFAGRFPFFYNLLNKLDPLLFYYISSISQIISTGLYFYFIVIFVDFNKNYPKLYQFSIYILKSIIAFGVIYLIILIVFPFLPYKFRILTIYTICFTIISLGVYIYLMTQKPTFTTRVILFGSLLLIIGNFLTIILSDFRVFLNTAVAEIILFSLVISYNNKLNLEKSFINQFALEKEKKDKETLIELDTMKTNFFSNISHEFRTPLTLISGPIQKQLSKQNLNEDDLTDYNLIKRNSDRLLSLVEQILDISKIKAGNFKLRIAKNNITSFITILTDGFLYQIKQKNINFITNINPTRTETWYDKDVIEKIITNLITNAIKYTPDDGSIICNASVINNQLEFEIKNSGKGLSKEKIVKIFERFYQVNKGQKGVGIGLALVKELISLNKGSISVESEPNQWTTFKFIIPVIKSFFNENEIEIDTENKIYSIENNTSKNIKITTPKTKSIKNEKPILLIVDDNKDLCEYIKSLFKNEYTILLSKNGKEGIDLAIEHIPDIIISDIIMPVKNGIELCNTLKTDERTSHIPIILLTAKSGDENKLEGIKTGADDYITKPFNNELLILKVQKLIEIRKKLQERYSQEIIFKPKDLAINSAESIFLERVQIVLNDNLIESSFNIKEFSAAVGMSRMQLHRKLKALTGLSASEFIRSQRLKLAAQLLKGSDVNVSQIGYSVGFNDHAYFSKRFKEMFNCTPTEYAKQ